MSVHIFSYLKHILIHTIQPTNVRRHSSVHMEEIDDDDDLPRNVAPANNSRILELSDGSDDDNASDMDMDGPCSPLVAENEKEGANEDLEEEVEDVEESAEAELGQPFPW